MTNENAKGCGLWRGVEKLWEWVKKPESWAWIITSLIVLIAPFSDHLKWLYHAVHGDWVLHDLNAGLFQVVIIAILTLVVTVAVAFFDSDSKDGSQFKATLFLEEVLGFKRFALICVIGVFAFAFCSGEHARVSVKLYGIYFCLLSIRLLSPTFKKLLDYIKGERRKFVRSFFEKNKLDQSFSNDKNKLRSDNLFDAYSYLWARESEWDKYEEELTSVFIDHVESAIGCKAYVEVLGFIQTYFDNIDSRDYYVLGTKFFPKVLEWSEELFSKKSNKSDSVLLLFNLYIALFEKICIYFFSSKEVNSWKANCKNFSKNLKNHMEKCEKNLGTLKDPDAKKYRIKYIESLIDKFANNLFSRDYLNDKNWRLYFPYDWRVKGDQVVCVTSELIINKFDTYAREQFQNLRVDSGDQWAVPEGLLIVTRHLFPNIHTEYFMYYLYFYYCVLNADRYKQGPVERAVSVHLTQIDSLLLMENFRKSQEKYIPQTVEIIDKYFSWIFKDNLFTDYCPLYKNKNLTTELARLEMFITELSTALINEIVIEKRTLRSKTALLALLTGLIKKKEDEPKATANTDS